MPAAESPTWLLGDSLSRLGGRSAGWPAGDTPELQSSSASSDGTVGHARAYRVSLVPYLQLAFTIRVGAL